MNFRIDNRQVTHQVFFFRAKEVTGLYTSSALTPSTNLIGKSYADCSVSIKYPVPENDAGDKTFFFELAPAKYIDLYISSASTSVLTSAVVWCSPLNAKLITSLGPQLQSQCEFNVGSEKIHYDITFVEGVSCGIKIGYTPPSGPIVELNAVPGTPGATSTLLATKTKGVALLGYNVIPSNKHTEADGSINKLLASAPSSIADTACGQHRSRVYYHNQYETPGTYCNWLNEQGAQAYTWALDEWVCMDGDCGYGGAYQPVAGTLATSTNSTAGPNIDGCEIPNQFESHPTNSNIVIDYPANIYSCGYRYNQPQPSLLPLENAEYIEPSKTALWWTTATGCQDRLVGDVDPKKPLQESARNGKFVMSFENLAWLTDKVDLPATASTATAYPPSSSTTPSPSPSPIPGDTNGDGVVDENDVLVKTTVPTWAWVVVAVFGAAVIASLIAVGVFAYRSWSGKRREDDAFTQSRYAQYYGGGGAYQQQHLPHDYSPYALPSPPNLSPYSPQFLPKTPHQSLYHTYNSSSATTSHLNPQHQMVRNLRKLNGTNSSRAADIF